MFTQSIRFSNRCRGLSINLHSKISTSTSTTSSSLHFFESGGPAATSSLPTATKPDDHIPTVIFLHGLGVSSWMWKQQIDALNSNMHCIAIDLPGNGASSTTEPWVSLSASADSVAAIIQEKTQNQSAHIVGLSLGGYVAIQLLHQHPHLVESMVVSGISTTPILTSSWLVNPIAHFSAASLGWPWLVEQSGKMMKMSDEQLELYKRDVALLSNETAKSVYKEVLTYQLPELSSNDSIQQKLLAVAGSKENVAVTRGIAKLHKRFPHVTTALAPNGSHTWNVDFPDLFADMLRAWILQKELPEQLQILHDPKTTNTPKVKN